MYFCVWVQLQVRFPLSFLVFRQLSGFSFNESFKLSSQDASHSSYWLSLTRRPGRILSWRAAWHPPAFEHSCGPLQASLVWPTTFCSAGFRRLCTLQGEHTVCEKSEQRGRGIISHIFHNGTHTDTSQSHVGPSVAACHTVYNSLLVATQASAFGLSMNKTSDYCNVRIITYWYPGAKKR